MVSMGIVQKLAAKCQEGSHMAVCYNRLWKLLIDRRMTKTQLCKEAGVTTNAIAKMGRDESVQVETLVKI